MEFAKGGDLFGYIVRNTPVGRLPEDHAQSLFQQLILGLDFCHRMVGMICCWSRSFAFSDVHSKMHSHRLGN